MQSFILSTRLDDSFLVHTDKHAFFVMITTPIRNPKLKLVWRPLLQANF